MHPFVTRPIGGRLPALAAAVLAVLAAGACGGPGDARSGAQPQPTASARAVGAAFDVTTAPLPLDRFRLTDDETREVSQARRTLLERCAAGFGLTLPPHRAVPEVGPGTRTERRYGVFDASLARADGYHLGARDPRLVDGKDRWLEHASPDVLTVVYGERQEGSSATSTRASAGLALHGRAIPRGGCLERARVTLREREVDPAGLVSRLDGEGWEQARATAGVQRAAGAWSACMRAAGHAYADPFDAINDPRFQGARATPAEIATASADVECRRSSGLVRLWYEADVHAETVAIAREAAQLRTVRAAQLTTLRAARAVLDPA